MVSFQARNALKFRNIYLACLYFLVPFKAMELSRILSRVMERELENINSSIPLLTTTSTERIAMEDTNHKEQQDSFLSDMETNEQCEGSDQQHKSTGREEYIQIQTPTKWKLYSKPKSCSHHVQLRDIPTDYHTNSNNGRNVSGIFHTGTPEHLNRFHSLSTDFYTDNCRSLRRTQRVGPPTVARSHSFGNAPSSWMANEDSAATTLLSPISQQYVSYCYNRLQQQLPTPPESRRQHLLPQMVPLNTMCDHIVPEYTSQAQISQYSIRSVPDKDLFMNWYTGIYQFLIRQFTMIFALNQ